MTDENVQEQAAQLECLLPRIMRRLFTLDQDHPAAELPVAQLRVCTILQAGPRTLSTIGDELAISVSAVTQLADRLERAGFVERITEGDDRRVKWLRLTARGAALMCLRRESRTRRAARALEQMTAEERADVLQTLHTLLTAATAASPEPATADPVGVRLEQ